MTLATKIKTDIGIDDVTTAVAMLGPGSEVASFTIGAAGLPLIAAGFVGAVQEAHRHVTQDVPRARRAVRDQMARLDSFRALPEPGAGPEPATTGIARDVQRRYEQVRLAEAERELKHAKSDRNLAPLEVVGMGMLTAGVASSVVSSGAAIAGATLGGVLGTVTPALLVPAQVMLGVRAAETAHHGIDEHRRLKAERGALKANREVLPAAIAESMVDHNRALTRSNDVQNIAYGTLAGTGQLVMATAGVLNATGVLAPVGIGLGFGGAGVSVVAAGLREGQKRRDAKLTGANASEPARAASSGRDVSAMLSRRGLDETTRQVGADYADDQALLVRSKIASLISHVIDREEARARSHREPDAYQESPDARRDAVEKLVRTGRKGLFAGTSLSKSDLFAMRRMFDSAQFPVHFFGGHRTDVQRRVNALLLEQPLAAQSLKDAAVEDRIDEKAVSRLLRSRSPEVAQFLSPPPPPAGEKPARRRIVEHEELQRFREGNAEVGTAYDRAFGKQMSRQLKSDAKFLKHHDVLEATRLGQIRQSLHDEPWHADGLQEQGGRNGLPSAPPEPEAAETWL